MSSFLDWIELERNAFTRMMCHLLRVNLTLSGSLTTFSDFITAVISMSLFSQQDLMKCKQACCSSLLVQLLNMRAAQLV